VPPSSRRTTSVVATLLTTAAITIGGTLVAAPTQAATVPTMVVIGDSITWRYNNTVGSTNRGWWSYLGTRLHLKVVRYAERGSGFGKRGKASDGTQVCEGTTFYERLRTTAVTQAVKNARVVIVAGGVNDFNTCKHRSDGSWYQTPTDPARLKYEIHRTMTRLAAIRPTRKSSVYITSPFGPFDPAAEAKKWIVPLIHDEAKAAGFHYVDTATGTLDGDRTDDMVHPNAAGNLQLYRDLFNRGSLERWDSAVTAYALLHATAPTSTGHPYDPASR